MKSRVKLTRKVKDYILNKMAQGSDVSEICRKWPDKVPARETIYRAQITDAEFGREMTEAYTILLQHRLDNLHEVASMTPQEFAAKHGIDDWRQAEATLKRMMDECKFVLAKMGPVLTERFKSVQKLDVSGEVSHLVVQNYYREKVIESDN